MVVFEVRKKLEKEWKKYYDKYNEFRNKLKKDDEIISEKMEVFYVIIFLVSLVGIFPLTILFNKFMNVELIPLFTILTSYSVGLGIEEFLSKKYGKRLSFKEIFNKNSRNKRLNDELNCQINMEESLIMMDLIDESKSLVYGWNKEQLDKDNLEERIGQLKNESDKIYDEIESLIKDKITNDKYKKCINISNFCSLYSRFFVGIYGFTMFNYMITNAILTKFFGTMIETGLYLTCATYMTFIMTFIYKGYDKRKVLKAIKEINPSFKPKSKKKINELNEMIDTNRIKGTILETEKALLEHQLEVNLGKNDESDLRYRVISYDVINYEEERTEDKNTGLVRKREK